MGLKSVCSHAEPARRDALIVGVRSPSSSTALLSVCLLWPAWVWFAVMATGNHFWLDILAGIAVAGVAAAVVNRRELRRMVSRNPSPAPA